MKTTYTITQHDDSHFTLDQRNENGSIWPTTTKASARQIVARLSQLLGIGPVAPQTSPESVCIGELDPPSGKVLCEHGVDFRDRCYQCLPDNGRGSENG